jgi:hypothetical protein
MSLFRHELRSVKIGMYRLILLILGVAVLDAAAGEIRILNSRMRAGGSGMDLVFTSNSANYYEVWTANEISGEWRLTAMILGADGQQTWSDDLAGLVGARYYRLVARSRTEPADADNDGLDDIFELTHAGMNPLARDRLLAVSVTAAQQSIAAGALPTKVHQTEVVVHVTPPSSYRLSVWLEGGDGYTDGGISTEGPAKLETGHASFIAGGTNASQRPMIVTTDANGRAVLLLTSSNEINEQSRVHARLGTQSGFAVSDATSAPVTFELGTLEVTFPRYLARDAYSSAVVNRTLNGVPIPGHETEVYVRRVQVNSQDITADRDHTDDLASYAAIQPAQRRQRTDENGRVTAPVLIRDVEGLGYVEVKAVDLQVFAK